MNFINIKNIKNIKNYINYHFIKNYINGKIDNLYIYYLRHQISKAASLDDLITILKKIEATHIDISTDELSNILLKCFTQYPLSEIELQKLSTWQQLYELELGLHSYVATIFWICSIQAIQETKDNNSIYF